MTAATVVLLTAAQAHQYLGIPAGTVYSWRSRGELRPLDRDASGRPRYEVGELLRLRDDRPLLDPCRTSMQGCARPRLPSGSNGAASRLEVT